MVDGRLPEVANGASRTVRSNVAGPDFFRTLGVPVLAGRDFADSDTASSPHVGIINEQFAQRFLPHQNPLGHTIGTDDGRFTMTIVGVVKDHKYREIHEDPIPMAWYMYAQIPIIGAMQVEMRVHGPPLAILPSARKAVQQLDPNLPLIQPMTQRAQFDTTISGQTLFARLAGFFGVLAVVLVATGLYGSLAYRVSVRIAEIGVRMAVGARREQVVWMILKDSLLLTVAGVALGYSAGDVCWPRIDLVVVWCDAARYGQLSRRGFGGRCSCAGRECAACRACCKCRSHEGAANGIGAINYID